MTKDKPAFEIITDDHHFKIWSWGEIEVEPEIEGRLIIVNRIPQLYRGFDEQ